MISRAEADQREVAVLVIGLDGFQQINDMLGHASGDLVLRAISERLTAAIPAAGMVARLSGDEFAIAVRTSDIGENVSRFADQIGAAFDAPLLAGNRQHRVRVSIGAAVFPGGGRSADELLSNCHLALSRAKATRRGGHVLFEEIRSAASSKPASRWKPNWRWRRSATSSNCSISRNCIWPTAA